ncbi:MAG: putative Ig domain-containing protein [Candidatus Acidiferrales bacterium]
MKPNAERRAGWAGFSAAALAALLLLFLPACGGGGGGGGGGPQPLNITTTSVADGVNGVAYNQTVQATGGTGARTFSLASGALPTGLSLSAAGVISGAPTANGTFNFTVRVEDSATTPASDTQALTIRVADLLSITTTTLANGAFNVAYNAAVSATGGLGPFAWDISSGSLPPGLALAASTTNSVNITGTPTSGGSFSFTVRVRDSLSPQQAATRNYTVLILQITTTGLPDGVENQSYSTTLSATGFVGPLSWSAPGLPTGLLMNSATGEISGIPTASGNFTVTAMVTDNADSRTASQQMNLFIVPQLQITTTTLPGGTTGVAYGATLAATGGAPPLTWSEPTASFDDTTGDGASGTPCEGLTLDFDAGAINGIPVNPGTCGPFTIHVDDSAVPAQSDETVLSIVVTAGPISIVTTDLPPGAVNRSYNQTIQANGGTPPFTWSETTASFNDTTGVGAAGTACEGLTLDFNAGTISGTPVMTGTCGTFTIMVTDSTLPVAQTDTQDLSILVNPEPVGRNDTVATASDLGVTGGSLTILASISPYADPVTTPNPDNDFYRVTATGNGVNTVTIEIFARRLGTPSVLDSVIELVTDDSSADGLRITTGCKDEGNFSGTTGEADPTPADFDDPCVNDDLDLGVLVDSKLQFLVPGSGTFTFFIRVLDWRGDARPDLIYELHITGAN